MRTAGTSLRQLVALGLIGLLFLPALACGGRGGGDVRPTKEKTIVGNTPEGYEVSVAQQLGFWSSRWQIMSYALMSGAGQTTSISEGDLAYLKYFADSADGSNPAQIPVGAPYLLIPHRYANANYAFPANDSFLNFSDEHWTSSEASSGYDTLTSAYLIMSEVELARQFHSSSRFGDPQYSPFGSNERLQGMILCELAKKQALHFVNNQELFTTSSAGKLKMIAALSDLVKLLRLTSISGINNRYRDVNFAGQIQTWTDYLFESHLKETPAPTSAGDLCEAILDLAYFMTTTLDSTLRNSAVALVEKHANSLASLTETDCFSQASQIRGLVEAGRLLYKTSYFVNASNIFEAMQEGYDSETGLFIARNSMSTFEVARIIGALNSLRNVAYAYSDSSWAELIMSDFIAASVFMSNLYSSAFPISVVSSFEQPSDPLLYSYPGILGNREGDGLGSAPHFRSHISQNEDGDGWEHSSDTFDAVSALSLALEMLWLRPTEFEFYPEYSAGLNMSLRDGRTDYSFGAATSNAYFTGRTAALEFALRSASGEVFDLTPEVKHLLTEAVATENSTDLVQYPANVSLLRVPYTLSNPSFREALEGGETDYGSYRWTLMGGEYDDVSIASLMLLEARLAIHLHNDARFGISGVDDFGGMERLKGMMLFEAIKQQIADIEANSYPFALTFEGSCKFIEALHLVRTMAGSDTLENSATNRYLDNDLFISAKKLLEAHFLFINNLPLPENLHDLRLLSSSLFSYTLQITDLDTALQAKDKILTIADAALNYTLDDAIDKADLIQILVNALRLFDNSDLQVELRKAFVQMLNEYDPYFGIFTNKESYSLGECSAILDSLLYLYNFNSAYVDHESCQNLIRGYFEGTYMLSGLLRSAWAPWEYPTYEYNSTDSLYLRYPTIQHPLYAGGEYGIAPAFARTIQFDNWYGYWNVTDYDNYSPDLLYTSDVMIRCNLDCFQLPEVPSYLQQ